MELIPREEEVELRMLDVGQHDLVLKNREPKVDFGEEQAKGCLVGDDSGED